jgi:hypothetical protein
VRSNPPISKREQNPSAGAVFAGKLRKKALEVCNTVHALIPVISAMPALDYAT